MKTTLIELRRPVMPTNWLALNVVLLALVAILSLTYPVEEMSRRLGDAFFRLRGPQQTSKTVAIVLIDDASLERFGRWPWPRGLVGRLLLAVSKEKPAAIGIDILLSEPGDLAGDAELARAIQDAGNVVLASKVSDSRESGWLDPFPMFRVHAAGVGHVQAAMDSDGIGRRVPLVELSANGPQWPLAVEMARVVTGQPIRLEGQMLLVGNRRIWVEGRPKQGRQLNEAGGWNSYSPQFLMVDFQQQLAPDQNEPAFVAVSAVSVLDGQAHAPLLGKAVLIGFGGSDLSDRMATPVSGQTPMPGVEVHANLVNGLLAERGIRRVGFAPQIPLLVAFSLLSTWFVLRRPGWGSVWIPLVLFAACYAAGFWLFCTRGMLPAYGPLFCTAVLAVPLGQLQSLSLVHRSLNYGLRQLRATLFSTSRPGRARTLYRDSFTQDSRADLRHKLDLIRSLESELAGLYTFRQNLLESMREGLAVFDATGKNEFCNPCWERFCEKEGWNPSMELAEFGRRLGHPAWSNLEERIRKGDLPPDSEVFLDEGFWQVRVFPLAVEAERAARWMVVITDLTSRLERDQARAEALRFVTHELRTPLVSIQGFSEFLMRYPQAEGSQQAAETIFRESQRLVSLINAYLDVLRFDAGARALRKEQVAIEEMVKQVERVMAPIADSADIRMHLQIDSSLPVILGDSPMLTGVLLNLLNNAVKYSPAGSEVSLQVRREESAVGFEVRNPGAPIAPEQLSHLFEPFYRVREQESSAPGWGLGLTFVKRIVDEHGGSIEATSDASGIRVHVRIPASPPCVEKVGHT